MALEKNSLIKIWEARAHEKAYQDFVDLNRENSGIQGNRVNRFTAGYGSAAVLSPEEKEKKEGSENIVRHWLSEMSESYIRSYEVLSQTIDHAQKAYSLALEDIRRDKEEAIKRLQEIQAKALVLEDGRRVYFTRAGSALFDDDGNQITDEEAIEEAQAALDQNPHASSHEDNERAKHHRKTIEQQEEEVFEKIQALEELKTRMDSGELSEDELDRKTQEILDSMSPDVRQVFDLVHGNSVNAAGHENSKPMNKDMGSMQHAFERAGRGAVAFKGEQAPIKDTRPVTPSNLDVQTPV